MNNIQSPWALRIKNANKYYETWSSRFKCDHLENCYEGFQWGTASGASFESLGARRPYTLNLVYATIRRKVANITYSYPEFILSPRPGHADWNPEFAIRSAQLKQDALNTVISDPKLEFVEDIKLAALDSFFRFGVMETGISSSPLNPNKPKIEMASHRDITISEADDEVINDEAPREITQAYTSWVSAKRFRVSMDDNVKLRNCNWCGYYSFFPKELILNTKEFEVDKKLKDTFFSVDVADASDYFNQFKLSGETAIELSQTGSLVKVWKVWDNISGEIRLILDNNHQEIYSEPFERINLATHRFDLSLKGWYPIPPVWQWLSSQNEINESREQMRKYRKRYTRKFEVSKGDHDIDELDKLKTEEDGSIIVSKRRDGQPSVRPIQNPEIGHTVTDALITAKDDFDIVTAQPVARGRASDRQTATATRAIQQDQSIVESLEQIDFSRFVSKVGRELLLTMGEKMPQGMWIKLTLDPGEQVMQELQRNAPQYQYITSQELEDGYDFDIIVNVINSTPAAMEIQEQAYVKFLSLVTQFPQIAMSPLLVRETAYRVNYKNERVIAEFQQMAMLIQMEKANIAGQSLMTQGLNVNGENGGGNANNQSKGMMERGMPNSPDEIRSQLMGQMG